MASVIGRSFYHRVLQIVDEASADLDRHLATLLRLDMIREAARVPEMEYSFRNPLTQEAVYNTILLKRRREFHRRVAEAMEALFPDRLAELAPRLAHHYAEAQQAEQAQHFFTVAGDNAFRLYANTEAVGQYSRALELARARPDVASEALAYLYGRQGRALELNSQHGQALALYQAQERLAQERGDRPLELAALVSQATILGTANTERDPGRAEELSQHALEVAHELGDEAAEAKILWNLLNIYRFDDRVAEGIGVGERSLELARKLNLAEQLAYTTNDLPFAYMAAGQFGRAKELLREASGLWRAQGNQPMLADSLASASTLHALAGDFATALALSDESYAISESIHNVWGISYSRMSLGILYWYRGDVRRALDMLETGYKFGDQAGFVVAQIWCRLFLALAYADLGQVQRGLALGQEALEHSQRLSGGYLETYQLFNWSVLAHLYLVNGDLPQAAEAAQIAEVKEPLQGPLIMAAVPMFEPQITLALAQGRTSDAVQYAADLMAAVRRPGTRVHIGPALLLYGEALRADGQIEASLEALHEARAEAEAIGARWTLWQALAALSRLEKVRGNAAEAEDLRRQAAEAVEDISRQIEADDLRQSFLALPDVREVLSPGG